jgi:epoxyqueuosine reductase
VDCLADPPAGFSQLLVFGHGGTRLWRECDLVGPDPIDAFSRRAVEAMLERMGCTAYRILFPADNQVQIDLQGLGRKLGWHHDSPLGTGINSEYGTWFAYRVVVATNTRFLLSETAESESPCESCIDKPCVSACPVGAVRATAGFDLETCLQERLRPQSPCRYQCLARLACPVGTRHQYSKDQIRYHYGHSLETITK